MLGKDLKNILVSAFIALPLNSTESWVQLQFNKIPVNQVSVVDNYISVNVDSSASPLVYKLKEPLKVTGFSFKIKITGEMNSLEKNKFEEDSYFRFGLVVSGEKTLGTFQRFIAADWVRKLFDLAPRGIGLDKIYFYNVAHSKDQLGQSRIHPKSELMLENVIKIKDSNLIVHEEKFDKFKNVVAVWISIDGDQSKSKYQIHSD